MVKMNLIVSWKNNDPFKIVIDDGKTLLELKKKIAEHYKADYTGFNILNGNDLIDNTKNSYTLSSLNIKRMIRLPVNYNPGNAYIN